MNVDDIREAMHTAKREIEMGDEAVKSALLLIKGHVRSATESGCGWRYAEALRAIKKELRGFNAVTGHWKD